MWCVLATVVKSRTANVTSVNSDEHKATATLVNLVNVLCLSLFTSFTHSCLHQQITTVAHILTN